MSVPLRALLTEKLGHDVMVYARGLRAAGRSWREVSAEISERSGVAVSHEALRRWDAEPATDKGDPA